MCVGLQTVILYLPIDSVSIRWYSTPEVCVEINVPWMDGVITVGKLPFDIGVERLKRLMLLV